MLTHRFFSLFAVNFHRVLGFSQRGFSAFSSVHAGSEKSYRAQEFIRKPRKQSQNTNAHRQDDATRVLKT